MRDGFCYRRKWSTKTMVKEVLSVFQALGNQPPIMQRIEHAFRVMTEAESGDALS